MKLVPNAVVLASLAGIGRQAGSQRGVAALRALEKTFGRVQALWKPVATEEAFEIVRRGCSSRDARCQDARAVCRAFADAYVAEGAKLAAKHRRPATSTGWCKAYPIHPEVFDRLYEDWTTIDGFQRTRGVLEADGQGHLPAVEGRQQGLDDPARQSAALRRQYAQRTDLLSSRRLGPGDRKGHRRRRAETTELETRSHASAMQAARRVARTLFLGTAPSSVTTKSGIRGLDRARVLLGCLQPGQTSSVYADALNRLADRLHYLNSSGDKAQDDTRFWFDTRANLRREMEDRKRRFDDRNEVRGKIADVLKKLAGNVSFFDGMHIFTPHADVPDDGGLRLVILPPENSLRQRGNSSGLRRRARIRAQQRDEAALSRQPLLFLAPDHGALARLRDAAALCSPGTPSSKMSKAAG